MLKTGTPTRNAYASGTDPTEAATVARMGTAQQQWADELSAWRIDEAILASAPEDPYSLPPGLFRTTDETREGHLHRRAREALPPGGTVLDVGCGGGVASLPLLDVAGALTGVDESASMLELFATTAGRRAPRVPVRTVRGRWPGPVVDVHDVVVCRNVAYNVADLATFALSLTAVARHRVVLTLQAAHPWVPLGPLWRAVHGQPRPTGPDATLAAQVLREAGLEVGSADEPTPPLAPVTEADRVAFTRRRLCLPAERDAEVAALLAARPARTDDRLVTLWWPGRG